MTNLTVGMEKDRRYEKESKRDHECKTKKYWNTEDQRTKSLRKGIWRKNVGWKKLSDENINERNYSDVKRTT